MTIPAPILRGLLSPVVCNSRAIVEKTRTAKRVAVVGASFIGLEVAASLRARNIDVDVIGPGSVPLNACWAPRSAIRAVAAQSASYFILETVKSVAGRSVTLSGGATIDADFVVV
jgi:NADPH-dependent 2,4-dienoyl-CoA reductase/sulfur reductase-like enzyme